MTNHLIVFDIETIPCIQSSQNLLHLPPNTPHTTTIQKLIEYHINNTGNPFPRQPFHQIICISFLLCEIEHTQDGENYIIKKIKTGGINGENEKEILEQFCNFLQKHKPRLISFNGKTFDLPVIQYRSMMHQIPCPWLHSKEISYKFNHDPHCDLIDAFSNFGSSARVKMSEICALLNIPCKQSGSGNEVLDMYNSGQIQKICTYCQEDVICTYMLYLYYQMHNGKIQLRLFHRLLEQSQDLLHQNSHNLLQII
jgi:predicted PolB exonuclease-like 3'-5' exonuclease